MKPNRRNLASLAIYTATPIVVVLLALFVPTGGDGSSPFGVGDAAAIVCPHTCAEASTFICCEDETTCTREHCCMLNGQCVDDV